MPKYKIIVEFSSEHLSSDDLNYISNVVNKEVDFILKDFKAEAEPETDWTIE